MEEIGRARSALWVRTPPHVSEWSPVNISGFRVRYPELRVAFLDEATKTIWWRVQVNSLLPFLRVQ